MMRNKKSIALVTIIVFIALIMLISIALFTLMTSQTRLVYHQIQRAKAFYAAEAAMVKNIELLRSGQNIEANTMVDWYFLSGQKDLNGISVNITYDTSPSGPYGTNELNFTILDYTP